jgi:hypothetical protein
MKLKVDHEIEVIASCQKNSFWRLGSACGGDAVPRSRKREQQPVHSPNLYNSSSMPVMFWEVPKKNKRSILASCAAWYPQRTKVATV